VIELLGIYDSKTYWKCLRCNAKFLDKAHFLSPQEEKSHYLKHENKIDDPAYRKFLSKLSKPLKNKLSPYDMGLDFGCGPGPALADMLTCEGFSVALYDPFFYPDSKVLSKNYNFITCTEVVEHFFDPFNEFDRFQEMLAEGGTLGIMTCFSTSDDGFKGWHYRRDPTHVVFYSKVTFQVIAKDRGWKFNTPRKNVVLMQKN
jgi:hypothetical protein